MEVHGFLSRGMNVKRWIAALRRAKPAAAIRAEVELSTDLSGDEAIALRLWRPLAVQGNAYAQYNLGLRYAIGQGVLQNPAEALKWYRLAADQGYADAQYSLGIMYLLGKGTPRDKGEAGKWLHSAAKKGNADAQRSLAMMSRDAKSALGLPDNEKPRRSGRDR